MNHIEIILDSIKSVILTIIIVFIALGMSLKSWLMKRMLQVQIEDYRGYTLSSSFNC